MEFGDELEVPPRARGAGREELDEAQRPGVAQDERERVVGGVDGEEVVAVLLAVVVDLVDVVASALAVAGRRRPAEVRLEAADIAGLEEVLLGILLVAAREEAEGRVEARRLVAGIRHDVVEAGAEASDLGARAGRRAHAGQRSEELAKGRRLRARFERAERMALAVIEHEVPSLVRRSDDAPRARHARGIARRGRHDVVVVVVVCVIKAKAVGVVGVAARSADRGGEPVVSDEALEKRRRLVGELLADQQLRFGCEVLVRDPRAELRDVGRRELLDRTILEGRKEARRHRRRLARLLLVERARVLFDLESRLVLLLFRAVVPSRDGEARLAARVDLLHGVERPARRDAEEQQRVPRRQHPRARHGRRLGRLALRRQSVEDLETAAVLSGPRFVGEVQNVRDGARPDDVVVAQQVAALRVDVGRAVDAVR
mmetsp:Transcript_19599/g.77988  ORF Transcript_19599/g.77988 Transcript_19599/m.77988 type:complete len:430 (-) Transcript_19599:424-1713(-)